MSDHETAAESAAPETGQQTEPVLAEAQVTPQAPAAPAARSHPGFKATGRMVDCTACKTDEAPGDMGELHEPTEGQSYGLCDCPTCGFVFRPLSLDTPQP